MLKLLFAALVAACAFLALAVHLNAGPIAIAVSAHPLLLLALVAITLAVAFLTALRPDGRRRVLRLVFPALGLLAVAACASGCSGVGGLGLPGGADQTAILNAVNAHIEGCERHYHGQTVPPSLSVQIDCPARPGAAPPQTPATPATSPQ